MKIIIHRITAGPFQENGYIIHSEGKSDCIIIDPGDGPELYIKEIENSKLKPIGIINTHGHIDHIHAIQPLKDHYSIPFYIHKEEKMIVDHYPQGCLMYGVIPNAKPKVDHWLKNEDSITIGDYKIKVIQT
ncbi:MAG: MBL fold metallo-hydrolase, partial [Candidatus Marinimicrobia bacterium]|nr:MBL fold metallo-hydrolase [Candidatus Neomarinimicrobiota bacterium]